MAFLHELLEKLYHAVSSISPWYVALAFVAVTNIKVLPFAWHTRLIYGMLRHVKYEKRPVPESTPEQLTLFQPSIYTSSTPLGELDYNLHKSNSTYLTDLDLARGHHILCLFRTGFDKYSKEGKARFFPALGAVTCNFKREIKPYVKYEVWSRVLSWDQKWIYIVTHFVKAGAVRPQRYSDHPWRKGSKKRAADKANGSAGTATSASAEKDGAAGAPALPHPAIYCTCITKYVMKKGRKSVPPEEFLRACGLMPEAADSTNEGLANSQILEAIEKRRKEGLAVAENVAGLDASHDWFDGSDEVAFAWY